MTEQRLEIAAMGRRGEAMAPGPVFVPYALPGETIVAEVDGERARVVRIENISPERVEPFCEYFGRCGGCLLQHWDETAYRQWKRGLVETAFRQRNIDVLVSPLIDAHGAGRRRVSLHVRRKGQAVTAGFMALRSHTLMDIARCPILVPALSDAITIARALGEKLGDCDVAMTASDVGIDAAVKAERKIAVREIPKLAGAAAALDLARLAVNGETVAAPRTPCLRMGNAIVALPVNSFLQATEQGEARLAELVIAAAGKSKSIADLFCGLGPFAFRLAERAKVAAFDNDRPAIAALNHAARLTPGLKPIQAATRDLFREPLVANELKPFEAVVFDPPRAGAEAQARQIARSKVRTVIAVSCDPTTLARDAEILLAGGYEIESVTPVDQFKWSPHVETVAVFRKK